MNPTFAGTLGLAATLVGTLAQSGTASAELPALDVVPDAVVPAVVLEVVAPDAAASEAMVAEAMVAEVGAQDANVVDPLDPELRPGEHELETGAMTKMCDLKCQALVFTEDTVPGLGASQVLYTILYPRKSGLSIPNRDGTTAVMFTILPTQIARGKGLIATGTF
jgi:hypothetical protein